MFRFILTCSFCFALSTAPAFAQYDNLVQALRKFNCYQIRIERRGNGHISVHATCHYDAKTYDGGGSQSGGSQGGGSQGGGGSAGGGSGGGSGSGGAGSGGGAGSASGGSGSGGSGSGGSFSYLTGGKSPQFVDSSLNLYQ